VAFEVDVALSTGVPADRGLAVEAVAAIAPTMATVADALVAPATRRARQAG
jgi:hypothetical protein